MMEYFMSLANALISRVKDEEGQALVEYGLLVGLIAVVSIVVIGTLGGQISTFFQSIVTALGG